MKKILSLLTAGALALGLIGCSGDLHDDELSPVDMTGYFVVGSMQGWKESDDSIALTSVEGSAYTYEATFTADADKVNFAFLPTKGSWSGQIGGEKMAGDTLPDGVKFEDTDNGNGGRNGTLSGLTAKSVYKMTVETSTGIFKISMAEQKTPEYFLLDSFYLKGSFDTNWAFDMKKVLINGEKNASSGEVKYQVMFVANTTSHEAVLSRFDDTVSYKGIELNAAAETTEVKELKKDGSNIKFTGLEAGKGYFVNISTTTDEKVTMSISEAACIYLCGVQVVGIDTDDFAVGTNFNFGGNLIGWPASWGGTTAADNATQVDADGILTLKFAESKKIYDIPTTTDVQAVNITGSDWGNAKRICAKYNINGEEKPSVDLSQIKADYNEYILFADVSGLVSGDAVEWKIIPKTVKVQVTGLPAALYGAELYSSGFNGWTTPGDDESLKVKVSETGSLSCVVCVPGSNAEGKFASAGWTTPEIVGSDGENIKVSNITFGSTIKGVYSTVTGDKYRCTWTVE